MICYVTSYMHIKIFIQYIFKKWTNYYIFSLLN